MTKDVGILILGLLTALMPFLGFPRRFESFILIIVGLTIAVLAFIIRGEALFHNSNSERKTDMFVENGDIKQKKEVSGDIIPNENTNDDTQNNSQTQ